jgi:hypothetical protein
VAPPSLIVLLFIFSTLVPDSPASGTLDSLQASLRGATTPGEVAVHTEAMDFPVEVKRTSYFVWPAAGPINSYYGSDHPLGIDIGLQSTNTPIVASAAGVVSFTGGSVCCSYGYHIIIDHGGGLSTVYGHLSRFLVSEGQRVEQGQSIGYGGNTGNTSGLHLHFEVRDGQAYTDPLRYLPASITSASVETVGCPNGAISVVRGSRLALRFTAAALGGYVVTKAELKSLTHDVDGTVSASATGGLGVIVEAPAVPAPDYNLLLALTLRKDDDERSVACGLHVSGGRAAPTYNVSAGPSVPRASNATTARSTTAPANQAQGSVAIESLYEATEAEEEEATQTPIPAPTSEANAIATAIALFTQTAPTPAPKATPTPAVVLTAPPAAAAAAMPTPTTSPRVFVPPPLN